MEELNNQSMTDMENYKRQLIENFNKSIGISDAPVPDLQKYNPKPEAADISKKVTGNPITGSNPGANIPDLRAHNEYLDNLSNKLDRSLETNYNSNYVTMRPYSFNSDYDGAKFERYYNSKYFKKLGFSPHQDNETLYNNRMTVGDEFVRAASMWPQLFWTGLKSNVTNFSKMFTDPLSPDMQGAIDMERNMTLGSSTKEGVGPFMVNQFLNSAYTVGVGAATLAELLALKGVSKGAMALGEATGLTEATKIADETIGGAQKVMGDMDGLRTFFNQNKIGKAMAATGRILNPLEGTWQVGKQLIRGENAIGHLNNYARWVDNFGMFAKDAIMINAAVSEARLEGGMNQMQTTKALVDEYRKQKGKDPDGEAMASIEAQASEESRRTAFWNLPAIMWSNKFMYETIFRPFEKGGAKLIDDVVFNPKTQSFELLGSTLKERAQQLGKSLLTPKAYYEFGRDYLKANLAEGLQENIQEAISTGATEHAKAVFRSPERAAYESYMGHFMKGMKQQLSAQGAETFAGGFLMGAIAGPVMSAPMKAMDYIANKTWNKEEYMNRQAEKDKNNQEVVSTLNDLYKNPQLYFAPELTNVVNQTKLNQDLFTAQEEYNKKKAKDIKDLSVFDNVFTALQTGHYDVFINKLENYKKFTPEEAGEAFYGKRDPELGKAALGQIDNIIERAKLIKTQLSDTVGSFPNPFDPSRYAPGSVEHEAASRSYTAWNEALKNLVFAKVSFQTHSKRIKEMEDAFISKSKPIENASAQDLMVLLDPAALMTETDLLKKEIQVLSTEDPDSKKERERKIKKLDHLQNIYNNIHRKAALKEIVDGLTDEEKRNISGLSKLLKTGQARKSLINYMKFLAKDTKSFAFDEKLEAALDLIGDSLLLRDERASLVQSINVLNNPKGFFNLQNRLVQVYKTARDNQRAIIEENIKDINTKAESNAALVQFYKQYGIKLTDSFLLKFYDDIKNKRPVDTPTEFIDDTTNTTITSGDKFNSALEAWKRMTAEISKEAAEQYFGKEETTTPPPPPTPTEEPEETTVTNRITKDSNYDTLPKQLKDLLNPLYIQWAKDNELTEEEATIPENKNKFLKENLDNIMDAHIDIRSMINDLNKNVVVTNEEEPVSFVPANFDVKPNAPQQTAIDKLSDIVNKKIRLEEDEKAYTGGRRRTSEVVEDMLVNIFNREPFYKFMDRKGDMEVKNVTDIYNASSKNIDKLINDLKAGSKLGNILSDEQFLKIKAALEENNTFETFKKKVNDLSWSGGSERGNTIDKAIRNYFNGLANERPEGMTNNAYIALYNNLTALHNYFNNRGIIIVGAVQLGKRDVKIVTSNENVAGELDLIGVNQNGEYEIFDIKTATDEKWENFFDEETKESALLRYTLQQSIYKKLIEDETGNKVKSINLIPIETDSDTKTGFINSVKWRTKGLLIYATPGAGKSEFVRKANQLKSEQPDNVQDIYQEFVDADRLLIDEIKKQGEAGKLPGFTHTQSDKDETAYLLNFALYSMEKLPGARQSVYSKVANDIKNLLNTGISVMTGSIDYINSKLEADLMFVTPQFSKYSRETFDVLDPRTDKIQRDEHNAEIEKNPNERIDIDGPIDTQISIFSSWIIPLRYEPKVEEVIIATTTDKKVNIGDTLTSDSGQNYRVRGFTDKGGIQWENTKDGSKGVWSKEKFDEYIKDGRLKYDAELATLKGTKPVVTKKSPTKSAKQAALDQYNKIMNKIDEVDNIKSYEELEQEYQETLNVRYLSQMEILILERKFDDLQNFVYNRLNLESLKYIQEMGDIIIYNNPKNPDISGQYLIETVGKNEITLRSNTSTVKVPIGEISNMRYFNVKEDTQQFTEEEIETILNNIEEINTAKRNMKPEEPGEKPEEKPGEKPTDPDDDLLNEIC